MKMAAYIMIDRLSVTDRDRFTAYPAAAQAAVQRYGGRYVLPHGTQIEALEGNWKPNRVILIEFDDAEQARQWWNSPEYAEAKAIHQEATISNIILVAGASSRREPRPDDRVEKGGTKQTEQSRHPRHTQRLRTTIGHQSAQTKGERS
jgi:uncharacterized protein (DUF1330 family)